MVSTVDSVRSPWQCGMKEQGVGTDMTGTVPIHKSHPFPVSKFLIISWQARKKKMKGQEIFFVFFWKKARRDE